MAVLCARLSFKIARLFGQILLAVILLDKGVALLPCLFRYTERVGSHICYKTCCAEALYLHTFIKLLRYFHSALSLKSELSGGVLLHGGGCKRRRRRTSARSFFDRRHGVFRILKSCQNRVGLLFCFELYLAGFVARKRCLKRLF